MIDELNTAGPEAGDAQELLPDPHHLLHRAHQHIKRQGEELRQHRARHSVLDLVERLVSTRYGGDDPMMPSIEWELEQYLADHEHRQKMLAAAKETERAMAKNAARPTVEKMVDEL